MRNNQHAEIEILIKWKDTDESEATWEKLEKMKMQYPELHLEDKLNEIREALLDLQFLIFTKGKVKRLEWEFEKKNSPIRKEKVM